MNLRFLKPKKIFTFCLTLLFALSSSIQVFALNFNGASGSSGGGGTASSGYAVNTDGSALIGFRFSLVDSSNYQTGYSVDVVSNSNYSVYTKYNKFDYKTSKAEWIRYYSTANNISATINNDHFYNGSALGFKTLLPSISSTADLDNLSADLKDWQQYEENIDVVLSLINSNKVTEQSQLGDYKIIIEPLFSVALTGGSDHILTMTELAVYGGGFEYNGNFSTIPKVSSTNTGSWEFIAGYTNRHFPNYMRTDSADCNWGAAPSISTRISFKDIITKGYGANVLSSGMTTYTVKYDANGGSGAPSAQTKYFGVDLKLSTQMPTRAGYTFSQWNTEKDGTGKRYASGVTYKQNADLTLYAQWNAVPENTLTIEYYSNYADVSFSGALNTVSGDKIVLVRRWENVQNVLGELSLHSYVKSTDDTFLHRAGYAGTGYWGTEQNGGTLVHQDTTFSSAIELAEAFGEDLTAGDVTIKLYPQWATSYTVLYDANDGTGAQDSQTKAHDVDLTLEPPEFTRTGYYIVGWNTKADYTGDTYYPGGKYTKNADITLYAMWSPTRLEINYYSNYADQSSKFSNVEAGKNVRVDTYALEYDEYLSGEFGIYSSDSGAFYMKRAGYTATGEWGTSPSGGTTISENMQWVTAQELAESLGVDISYEPVSIDVYAQWEGNKLTVNYYSNYADKAFDGALNAVGADKNVHVSTSTFEYATEYQYGLRDYSSADGSCYLQRTGYLATGYWGTTTSGGTKISQSAEFASGKALAEALGVDLSSGHATVNVYAQWKSSDSIVLKGLGYATVKLGDVFDPMEHINAFNISSEMKIIAVDVIYNGVPRDSENRTIEVGTGYTVVYNMAFEDGTMGQYRLIVTVLDEASMTPSQKGYIRSISRKHLDTLETNSKWRLGELWERLEKVLSIEKPTDDDAVEVWYFKPEDVQAVKDWVKESETAHKSREEQNAEFGSKFGRCQTKGKYAGSE